MEKICFSIVMTVKVIADWITSTREYMKYFLMITSRYSPLGCGPEKSMLYSVQEALGRGNMEKGLVLKVGRAN